MKDPLPKMTKSMWDYFCKNMQSAECFHKKLELKEALTQMFKDIFPCKSSHYQINLNLFLSTIL